MKLLLLDNDVSYLRRVKLYLEKKHPDMQLKVYDSFDTAKSALSEEKFDVVLFDGAFASDDISVDELIGDAAFAYISGTNEMIEDKDTIFKYCTVSEMYAKICSVYERKKNRIIKTLNEDEQQEKSIEVITFLPVHGGAGSSTMAAACAIYLAEMYDVLYIDLEQRPTDSVLFFNGCKKGITDIVALMKTKYSDAALYKLLSEVIQKDRKQSFGKVSYIKGFTNIMESASMTPQCLSTLIEVIRNKFNFRYVIIDTDLIVGPLLNAEIMSSDKLIFVSSGSDISNLKLDGIHRYLDVLSREAEKEMPQKFMLFNQYYGIDSEQSIVRDMEVIARLGRYRTDDKTRITTQQIIDEVTKKDVFARLRAKPVMQEN